MKVALVHDFLTRFGGAEFTLKKIQEVYPDAPIYTLLADPKLLRIFFKKSVVNVSFAQKAPNFFVRRARYLAPFLPAAIESFDFSDFDLIISSSSAFAKGIISKPKTKHVCYCHSPMRYVWDYYPDYVSELPLGFIGRKMARLTSHYLRLWDRASSERVDCFIANSKSTQERIRKYYKRDARLVYPPVKMPPIPDFFQRGDNYFLIVSTLTPYKKIDLAIQAFNKLKIPLVIIGQGSDRERLEAMAESNIVFLGWQNRKRVEEHYANCYAYLLPGEEDFGISAVEAMSFGKPVLALRKGGATETILEGITGEFFDFCAPEIIADGVRRMKQNYNEYSPLVIRKRAEKFSQEFFLERFSAAVNEIVGKS